MDQMLTETYSYAFPLVFMKTHHTRT